MQDRPPASAYAAAVGMTLAFALSFVASKTAVSRNVWKRHCCAFGMERIEKLHVAGEAEYPPTDRAPVC